NNCRSFETVDDTYLMLFRNISHIEYVALSDCEQGEHKRLTELSGDERKAWMNSFRLDKPSEGRDEFFGKHWQRLNALLANPHFHTDALYRNIKTLADEGVRYLEVMVGVNGIVTPEGNPISRDEMIEIYRQRLAAEDVRKTGMTVRLQLSILRFLPGAERDLRDMYATARDNADVIVGINLVGREDNDKGHPSRFLDTLRELRRDYDVALAIHGGEVDEPNDHVRDTLLLGAERIGHGINLITDDDLMLDMRYGPYLVEINLISNLLLEYIVDFSQHPFPEYLRIGIPVALSTDDRGMWDSTLTDEFYVAVREYDLTWTEVVTLSRNSLKHALLEPAVKQALLDDFEQEIQRFERDLKRRGLAKVPPMPETRLFICARYKICD
ncbi:MAG: adenosine deaminase, partial [Pseudomonadota bacterium]